MSENLQESEAQDFPGPIFLPLSSKSARPGIGLLCYKYYLSPEARLQDVRFGLERPHNLVLGTSWVAPFVWRNDNCPTQWPVWCRKNKQFQGCTGQFPQITRQRVEQRFVAACSFRGNMHKADAEGSHAGRLLVSALAACKRDTRGVQNMDLVCAGRRKAHPRVSEWNALCNNMCS